MVGFVRAPGQTPEGGYRLDVDLQVTLSGLDQAAAEALLASAHAGAWADVLRRPILKRLYDGATFERYLLLGRHGRLAAAYDAEGTPLFREDGTDVEHGGDGHDFAQRNRVCGGGW